MEEDRHSSDSEMSQDEDMESDDDWIDQNEDEEGEVSNEFKLNCSVV